MSLPNAPSRRDFLRSGITAGALAGAGCLGTGGSPATDGPTNTPDDTVIQDLSFEGSHLVVQLQEDHSVTGLNLIAPDGTTFAQTTVATGATTVRIRLLDIQSGVKGYDHYTPGQYELVAVLDEQSISMDLELHPDLQITEITQYRDGDRVIDLGTLAVTVENVGTAPTWIYDLTYRDAPNTTTNDDLTGNPGVPQITEPEHSEGLIVGPSGRQTYVGTTAPFLFTEQETQTCSGDADVSVLVGVAVGEPLERRISATIGGEVQSAGLTGEYTCTDVSIELLDGADSDG